MKLLLNAVLLFSAVSSGMNLPSGIPFVGFPKDDVVDNDVCLLLGVVEPALTGGNAAAAGGPNSFLSFIVVALPSG